MTATGFGFSRTDSWDALNRDSSITFNYALFSKTVSYTYDQVGNPGNGFRKTHRPLRAQVYHQ